MDENNYSPAARMGDRLRRSSILKPAKPRNPLTEIEQTEEIPTKGQARKVRFSSNFVKAFATEDDKTIWERTFEEPIEKSEDSGQSTNNLCITATTEVPKLQQSGLLGVNHAPSDILTEAVPVSVLQDRLIRPDKGLEEKWSSSTVLVSEDMDLTQGVPTYILEHDSDDDVFLPELNTEIFEASGRRKTILSSMDMELTEAVPGAILQERILEYDYGDDTEIVKAPGRRQTILSSMDMELTEAVPVAKLQEGLASHYLKAVVSPDQAVQSLERSGRRRTILVSSDMELTEAVPGALLQERILEYDYDDDPEIFEAPGRRKTILSSMDMELTEAVPLAKLQEGLASHYLKAPASPDQAVQYLEGSGRRKTILVPCDMELTEPVPVAKLQESLASHYLKAVSSPDQGVQCLEASGRRKTILAPSDMEITEAVPVSKLQEGRASCPAVQSLELTVQKEALGRRKHSLVSSEIELTETVSITKGERRKTILVPCDMELTEAVPVAKLQEGLASHNLKALSSPEQPVQREGSGRRKTILVPYDMEITEAVPVAKLQEGLASHNLKALSSPEQPVQQEGSGRRKTILVPHDMEITEAVPVSKLQERPASSPAVPSLELTVQKEALGRRKTILVPCDMELTEAVPVATLQESLASHYLKAVSSPDPAVECLEGSRRRKTILAPSDMEITEAVLVSKLQEGPASCSAVQKEALDRRKSTLVPSKMELTETVSIAKGGRRKTILVPCDMELTEAVPVAKLQEGLASYNLKAVSSPDQAVQCPEGSGRRKTILVPYDMEITEAVPVSKLQEGTASCPAVPSLELTVQKEALGRRKTILVPAEMELTETVSIAKLHESRISSNKELTESLPLSKLERTILGPSDMEMTEAVPVACIKETLANRLLQMDALKNLEPKVENNSKVSGTSHGPSMIQLMKSRYVKNENPMSNIGQVKKETETKYSIDENLKCKFDRDLEQVSNETHSQDHEHFSKYDHNPLQWSILRSESPVHEMPSLTLSYAVERGNLSQSLDSVVKVQEELSTRNNHVYRSNDEPDKVLINFDQVEIAQPISNHQKINVLSNILVKPGEQALSSETVQSSAHSANDGSIKLNIDQSETEEQHPEESDISKIIKDLPVHNLVTPSTSFHQDGTLYSPYIDDTQHLIHYNLSGKKPEGMSDFSKILHGDYRDYPMPCVKHLPLSSFKIFSDDSVAELLVDNKENLTIGNNKNDNMPRQKRDLNEKEDLLHNNANIHQQEDQISNLNQPFQIYEDSDQDILKSDKDNAPCAREERLMRKINQKDILQTEENNQQVGVLMKINTSRCEERTKVQTVDGDGIKDKHRKINNKNEEWSIRKPNKLLIATDDIHERKSNNPSLDHKKERSTKMNGIPSGKCLEVASCLPERDVSNVITTCRVNQETLNKGKKNVPDSTLSLQSHTNTSKIKPPFKAKCNINEDKLRNLENQVSEEFCVFEGDALNIFNDKASSMKQAKKTDCTEYYSKKADSDNPRKGKYLEKLSKSSIVTGNAKLPKRIQNNADILVTPENEKDNLDSRMEQFEANKKNLEIVADKMRTHVHEEHDSVGLLSKVKQTGALGKAVEKTSIIRKEQKMSVKENEVDTLGMSGIEKLADSDNNALISERSPQKIQTPALEFLTKGTDMTLENLQVSLIRIDISDCHESPELRECGDLKSSATLPDRCKYVIPNVLQFEPLTAEKSNPNVSVTTKTEPTGFKDILPLVTRNHERTEEKLTVSPRQEIPNTLPHEITSESKADVHQESMERNFRTENIPIIKINETTFESDPMSFDEHNLSPNFNNFIDISRQVNITKSHFNDVIEDTSLDLLTNSSNDQSYSPTPKKGTSIDKPDCSDMQSENTSLELRDLEKPSESNSASPINKRRIKCNAKIKLNEMFASTFSEFENYAAWLREMHERSEKVELIKNERLQDLKTNTANMYRVADKILKTEYIPENQPELMEFSPSDLTVCEVNEFKTLKEMVDDQAKQCQDAYKIVSVVDNVYTVSTLYGTIILIVKVDDSGNGLVLDKEVVSKISDKADIIPRYTSMLFMKKLKESHITSSVGDKYTILTLLDFIQMNFQPLSVFDTDLMILGIEYATELREDFTIVQTVVSRKLKFAAEVIIDCLDYSRVSEECVKVNVMIGQLNEREVKKIAIDCPKGYQFVRSLVEKVEKYFSDKAAILCHN